MTQKKELATVEEPISMKTILVVEDDIAIGASLMQLLLQETGHQALLATDGFAALQVCRQIMPHLFLLDYQLPGMTGIQLYDQLHVIKGFAEIPGIILSAYLPKVEVAKRSLIGISKPFDLDELLATIEQLLA